MSLVNELHNEKLLPGLPGWMPANVQYETIMGSVAYGVKKSDSDVDIYGFAIPPKSDLFPHLNGEILGFGTQTNRFQQYEKHHIPHKDKEYDISIYSIVKYFNLVMENNPNMLDSLFTPVYCIRHCTSIAQLIRSNRDIFLHKGSYHKFMGYAYSQLSKIRTKKPKEGSKRWEDVQKHGFDCKFAYHIVRLTLEAEQILKEGTLVLDANSEILKSVRNGEWTEDEVTKWFSDKELALKKLYETSNIPHSPDEQRIKDLLLACLEEHYGNLRGCGNSGSKAEFLIKRIKNMIEKEGF